MCCSFGLFGEAEPCFLRWKSRRIPLILAVTKKGFLPCLNKNPSSCFLWSWLQFQVFVAVQRIPWDLFWFVFLLKHLAGGSKAIPGQWHLSRQSKDFCPFLSTQSGIPGVHTLSQVTNSCLCRIPQLGFCLASSRDCINLLREFPSSLLSPEECASSFPVPSSAPTCSLHLAPFSFQSFQWLWAFSSQKLSFFSSFIIQRKHKNSNFQCQ